MTFFHYRAGLLHAEDVPVDEIAAAAGTPVYIYSAAAMRARYRSLAAALTGLRARICYAVKANHNLAVIRTLAAEGAGADTVSWGEIARAHQAGVAPGRIVYAGVGKGDDEIRRALQLGILQFNVESVEEMRRIAGIAAAMGRVAPVALRINPDIGAGAHDKISTGRKGDKFGVAYQEAGQVLGEAMRLPGIQPVGLHLHIGSQITELEPFAAAFARAAGVYRELKGSGVPLERLDLGGGLGVRYNDETPLDPVAYGLMLRDVLGDLDAELVLEPGRWLVAEAGILVAGVLYPKMAEERHFLVLDAGMNTLLRPAMYGARHAILPVRRQDGAADQLVDVVGPICESSDIFGRAYALPPLESGDLVALTSAGAYGAVMMSDYNSRSSAAEVLIDGPDYAIVKAMRPVEEQFADDRIPDWLPHPPS
ncbi:diaminopimelate decarboxylase [Arboricoccus pini]|uniref:Diaminopimelate decarboxylase n=1 Tax=Arboricoccus pini TaxID=1963835 RepID=A0A212Q9P0_9PROT|nr:diaminopimelate decarboxylase [Arboricoccus pini]SNB56066.1 diaminopimelate decarboxylase [Arboricoccus pini]